MTEKLCLFCKHFSYSNVWSESGTDVTLGETYGSLTCGKSNFYEARPKDEEEYRTIVLQDEACRSYRSVVKEK